MNRLIQLVRRRSRPSLEAARSSSPYILAYTAAGGSYPGFVSIRRDGDGDVQITVRAAPTQRHGVHVCMHEPGPGRCTPGGPTCNNYCNLAPTKGPMQDHPLPCDHVDVGVLASFAIPAAEWARAVHQ